YEAIDPAYVHFDKNVEHFEQTERQVTLNFADGTREVVDYVIAADGLHSIFRQSLLPKSTPRYAGYTCWRGITKNEGDVPLHVSSEAWSKQGRFGWAPLHNGDVYWFACVNAEESDPYYESFGKTDLAAKFKHFSPI